MRPFPFAHATHPQWAMAAALVLAQLRAHPGAVPPLGALYITDHYAACAQAVLDHLMAGLPEVTDWVGAVGVGIAATGVEYFDEPAMAVMLLDVPTDQYQVFSGIAPLSAAFLGVHPGNAARFAAHTALVHADVHTPELPDLLAELAQRTHSGAVFGGVVAGRGPNVQFACSSREGLRGKAASTGVFTGGLSGVAFGPEVNAITRVTQGCAPVGALRTITAAQGNVVLALDGDDALGVLLADLGVSLAQPQLAMQRLRHTLAGLRDVGGVEPGQVGLPVVPSGVAAMGADVRVRHIVGLDPARLGVALGDQVTVGEQLVFCERNADAARADLMRMCVALRDEVESQEAPRKQLCGALYVSCSGRGGPHFGAPSAELQWVRRALGDVPLVGFFAGGEIAGQQLYGYTGVLTVFVSDVTDSSSAPL
jgi:small ligand-binding sensory domain FIST